MRSRFFQGRDESMLSVLTWGSAGTPESGEGGTRGGGTGGQGRRHGTGFGSLPVAQHSSTLKSLSLPPWKSPCPQSTGQWGGPGVKEGRSESFDCHQELCRGAAKLEDVVPCSCPQIAPQRR